MLFSWARRVSRVSAKGSAKSHVPRPAPSRAWFKPKVELLEGRIVPTYSVAAAPFQTINISGDPKAFTVIQFADDSSVPVSLGSHTFNFFGTTYSGAKSLYASSNGLITFGSSDAAFLNADLTGNPSQAAISPLWTDWLKTSGTPMLVGRFISNPDILILQWDQILHFLGNTPVTFQAILQLDTGSTPGNILFNYISINTNDKNSNGATATVGIKDAGNQGPNRNLVSYDSTNPLVGNGEAIQFTWIIPTPQPTITSLSPASVPEQSLAQLVTVNGTNFENTAVVQVNGTGLSTTFVSSSELQATLPASDFTEEGASLNVTVFNPGSPGLTSNAQALTVTDTALTGTSETISATEGQALPSVLVARFTDPGSDGTTNDYSATVTWDDGGGQSHTTAGTIQSAGNNTFDVLAANNVAYAEEGNHAVTVTITDQGGSTVTVNSAAAVADAALSASTSGISPAEGSSFTGVVASFTDADANGTASDYTATITWGDGHTTTGSVSPNQANGFDVAGTHTYAEDGAYTLNVQISDAGGATASTSTSITVADAALNASGTSVSATEGAAFTGQVAAFRDPGTDGTAADYSALITWAKGQTSNGTVSADGSGGFIVTGTHTFDEEGSFPVSVQITDAGGATATVASTATVADAALTPTGTQVNSVEGSPFIGVIATFTDADPNGAASDYSATIGWGDGTTSTGTISANNNGGFNVIGDHTTTSAGSYAVSVTISDAGGATASTKSSNTVADAPLTASGATVNAVEGASFTGVVASFSDADPNGHVGLYTATVTWEDGTTSTGTVTANNHGGFDITGTHTFAEEGTFGLTVSVADSGGASTSVTSTAQVADAPLSATGRTLAATEGATFSGVVASFTDADPQGAVGDYSATIAWGDGSTSTETFSANNSAGFDVAGTHTYAEEGPYSISTHISDVGGAAVTGSSTISVADAAPAATGASITATEGASFTGVVASFTDADPNGTAGDYAATIAWGDGSTSTGSISANKSGGFDVTGTHTYAEDGSEKISVAIQDAGGSTAGATSTANVADAALAATGTTITLVEGSSFTGVVASFTDADPNGTASDCSATITWDDGSTSTGSISANKSGGFDVTGTHTYAQEGPNTISVAIQDAGGSVAGATSTANVADAALAATGTTVTSVEGSSFTGVVASFSDADPNSAAGDYSATITWGDGSTSTGTISANKSGGFNVSGTHTYAEEGPNTISVAIRDAGGSTVGATSTANVADAALAATGTTVTPVEGSSFTGVVASFTDADPNGAAGDYAATITWGDGSTSTGAISANNNGGFNVSGTHTYAEEGPNTISVAIQDAGGSTAGATSTANVADAALTATGTTVTPVEGSSFTGVVASFTDADPNGTAGDYAATITWGDGSTSTGSISANKSGGFDATGTHTYAEDGSDKISVAIQDAGGSTAGATSTANVADAALAASAVPVNPTEGASFTGAVATFTDADPNGTAGDYSATIAWGDGSSSAGTIAASNQGGFTVTGTHTYAEEGSYPTSVTIKDTGGASTSISFQVNVSDAALTPIAQTVKTSAGTAFSGVVATLTDADPGAVAGDYSATITWGDSSASTVGSISLVSGTTFAVKGGHTYDAAGNFSLTVTIKDSGGTSATANSALTAVPVPPTVSVTDSGGTYNGNPFPAIGTALGLNNAPVSGSFSYTYYAGSAVSGSGSSTAPSTVGTYTVVAGFTSADPIYSNGRAQTTFTIAQASPIVTWSAPAPILPATPLSAAQLDATANVPGSFAYSPAPGTVLTAGAHTLSVTFTPADTTDYQTVTASTSVLVLSPGITVVGTQLYLVGGSATNDSVVISSAGASNTGSTGVQVTATLNHTAISKTYSQAFTAIFIVGYAGNDSIQLSSTLTVSAFVTAGNGNDSVQLGNGNNGVTLGDGNDSVQVADGNNVVTLGNGNDSLTAGNGSNVVVMGNGNDGVTLGNGNNSLTLGDGNDSSQVGNGSNVVVEGKGNDSVIAGNGDNLIAAGLGRHTVQVGNGSNILIDGCVSLTSSTDSLCQVLSDWAHYGASAADVASMDSRLVVTDNSRYANTFLAGSGLDCFWETYARDTTNRKATDLLN
jgi:hypothetical protein